MRYVRPATLADAVAELAAGGLALAGGTIVVPALATAPRELVVDVGRLDALRDFQEGDGGLTLGAGLTLEALAAHPAVRAGAAALAEAADAVGNPLVRRAGTLGGNLGFASPRADLPPALLVLDAEAVLAGAEGERAVPVAQAAWGGAAGSLLLAVRIPAVPGRRSAFRKFSWRRATAASIANVAVSFRWEDGVARGVRVAAGGLLVHAGRLAAAEAALEGRPPAAAAEDAARAAAEAVAPDPEAPVGAAYLRRLVGAGVRSLVARLGEP
ncbi:MAG: FAD binding domain-containing protein [Longimicrobiaceae bacterium]